MKVIKLFWEPQPDITAFELAQIIRGWPVMSDTASGAGNLQEHLTISEETWMIFPPALKRHFKVLNPGEPNGQSKPESP